MYCYEAIIPCCSHPAHNAFHTQLYIDSTDRRFLQDCLDFHSTTAGVSLIRQYILISDRATLIRLHILIAITLA